MWQLSLPSLRARKKSEAEAMWRLNPEYLICFLLCVKSIPRPAETYREDRQMDLKEVEKRDVNRGIPRKKIDGNRKRLKARIQVWIDYSINQGVSSKYRGERKRKSKWEPDISPENNSVILEVAGSCLFHLLLSSHTLNLYSYEGRSRSNRSAPFSSVTLFSCPVAA